MKELRKVEESEGKDAERERTFHDPDPLNAGYQQDEKVVSDELLEVFKNSEQALMKAWKNSRADKRSLL